MRRLLPVSIALTILAASSPALSQTHAPISPHCQKMMMIGCALSKGVKGRNAPAADKECAELLKEGECAPPMPMKIVKRDNPVPTDEPEDSTKKPAVKKNIATSKPEAADDKADDAGDDEQAGIREEVKEDAPAKPAPTKASEDKPVTPEESLIDKAANEELQQEDTVTVPPKDLISKSVTDDVNLQDTAGYAPAAKTGPSETRPKGAAEAAASGASASAKASASALSQPASNDDVKPAGATAAEIAPITVPDKETTQVNSVIPAAADPGAEPPHAETAPSKVVPLAPSGTAPAPAAAAAPSISLPAAIPSAPSIADAADIKPDTSGPMSLVFGTNVIVPGEENKVTLFLRRSDNNSPVTMQDLKEVHTKKLHLLVIDPSLKEYHHVHPTEGPQSGEYSFTFKPTASYFRVFADVTTIGSDNNIFVPGVLGVKPIEKATIDTVTRYESSDGANVSAVLSFDGPPKAGSAVMGKVRLVDNTGTPVRNLEPVMGTFGHIVAFSQDLTHVLHVHPMGMEPTSPKDLGGPELEFHLEPAVPGFVRLFVEVKIAGQDIYIPFGFTVQ